MSRTTRYQGAIIRDHHIFLLKQVELASGRSTWLLPGGGMEAGETEEQCVRREMLEETSLAVRVVGLLLDEASRPGAIYERHRTYLCHVVSGEAQPGHEPEAAYADAYRFTEVAWVDLRDATTWDEQVVHHPWTYPLLRRIQASLGYAEMDPVSGG